MGPPKDRMSRRSRVLRRAVRPESTLEHGPVLRTEGVNELISEALHPYPEDLVIVSKVGAVRATQGGWILAQRPDELLRPMWREPAHDLGIEQLGAVNIRRMERRQTAAVARMSRSRINLAEMVALREEGQDRRCAESRRAPLAEGASRIQRRSPVFGIPTAC